MILVSGYPPYGLSFRSGAGTVYHNFSAVPLNRFTQVISSDRAWQPRPHLSLLLWERVLDEFWVPLGDDFWHSSTLRSCAAVCRGWRPHARLNLWRTTLIQTESQVRRLLDLIADDPYLGELIRELQIYPKRPGVEFGCVSFHLPELTRALPNLRLLCLKRVNWEGYPSVYGGILARFRTLNILHLWFARFRTVADFLRLVWSLPHLRHLIVHRKIFFDKPPSEEDLLRLSTLRKRWACAQLSRLDVGDIICEEGSASLALFPPPGVFGVSLTSLTLQAQGPRLRFILDNISRYTRGLKFLQAIGLTVDFAAITPRAHDNDSSQDCALLPQLASRLPSADILLSITISVTGKPSGSRSRFLDVLVGDEDEHGVLRGRLPSLRSLYFQLQDGGSGYLNWWTSGIASRLPSVGDLVQVEIEHVKKCGWSEPPRFSPGFARLAMHVPALAALSS